MMKENNLDILMAFENANVFVDYYWDSHGKEVNWNEHVNKPTVWTKASVKIGILKIQQQVLDKMFDFEVRQLIVDGDRISGEVTSVKAELDEEGILEVCCNVTVGWG
jgi:hypothetical protein